MFPATATVAAVNAEDGDWWLALKANQDPLLSDVRGCFGNLSEGHPQTSTEDIGHGRKEHRMAVVSSAKVLAERHKLRDLKAFG